MKSSHTYIWLGLVIALSCIFAPSTASAAATMKAATTSSSLVGWWTFDDASGTKATDFSGNQNTATFSGTPTWVTGTRGKALNFNGSNYVTLSSASQASFSGTQPFSVSAWIYGNPQSRATIVSTASFVTGGYALAVGLNTPTAPGADALFFLEDTPSGNVSALAPAGSFATSTWTHLVGVYDGSVVKIYVNGLLKNTSSSGVTLGANPNALRIGGATQGGWGNFTGKIDDVRIYSAALSAADVASLYRSGQTTRKVVTKSGLVGWWTFDEGTSTIAHDFSGNSNNAAFTNSPTPLTGRVGQALLFNGTSNVLTAADSSSLDITSGTTVTLAAWIKRTTDAAGYETIISKRGASTNYELSLNTSSTNGSKALIFYSGGSISLSTTLIPVGQWTHVASVTDSVGTTYYVNGVAAGTTAVTAGAANADNLTIGNFNTQYFRGAIDDLRVYNRALSAAEIMTLYKENSTNINDSQNTKMTNGLVGFWSFNGADMNWTSSSAGTAYDRSGLNNNGTLTSMTQSTSPVSGKVGQALSFNGSSYVNAGDPANGSLDFGANQSFSIAFWMKYNYSPASDKPLSKSDVDSTGVGYGLYASSGSVFLKIGNGGSVLYEQLIPGMNDNVWHHAVFSVDRAGNCVRYKDGALVGTNSCSSWAATDLSNATSFVIGANVGGGNGRFQGSMDEVRIYNRALSAADAKQLYLMGK